MKKLETLAREYLYGKIKEDYYFEDAKGVLIKECYKVLLKGLDIDYQIVFADGIYIPCSVITRLEDGISQADLYDLLNSNNIDSKGSSTLPLCLRDCDTVNSDSATPLTYAEAVRSSDGMNDYYLDDNSRNVTSRSSSVSTDSQSISDTNNFFRENVKKVHKKSFMNDKGEFLRGGGYSSSEGSRSL